MFEKITRIDQKSKSFVPCYHMNSCLQKYTTHQFKFFLLFKSRQNQKSKNYENPTSPSKDTYKIIFIILFKLFSICNSFEFKVTQIYRSSVTDLVMCQCESCENVKDFVTSPHVMPHPIIS